MTERRTPPSAWAPRFRRKLQDWLEIKSQIEELSARARAIADEVPCGWYEVEDSDGTMQRIRIIETVRSDISTKELRRYVTDEILRRCTRKTRRKVINVKEMGT
jgi:hypothetical protein